jgi:hypothetical protein
MSQHRGTGSEHERGGAARTDDPDAGSKRGRPCPFALLRCCTQTESFGNQRRFANARRLRGIQPEATKMGDDEFMARYKARRLENGKMEVDLTED